MDVKFTLGLDFPNLPYYMEKNVICVFLDIWQLWGQIPRMQRTKHAQVSLTGTNAILRHIARAHNLCGSSQQEMVRVDMAAEQVMDMRWGLQDQSG